MLILLATLGFTADCVETVSPSEVATRVDDALLTWATMDEDGFKSGLDELEAIVPCLDEPLKPAQAAALHRVIGLRAFIDGDAEAATSAFRSAAAAEPGYKLSERLAPEGGKLWQLYKEAAAERPPIVYPMPLPKGYSSWVDGDSTDRRATEIPSIIQIAPAGEDEVVWTALVRGGEDLVLPDLEPRDSSPDLVTGPIKTDKPSKPAKTPKPPKSSSGGSGALWGAAAGTGVAAGGLFAASAALRSSYNNDPTKGKYNAVNGTYLASVGLGTVAGGLVIAALAKK